MPDAGAVVVIPGGTEVTLDSREAARLRLVRVSGTLFVRPDVDTSLSVETIFVRLGGRFQIGRVDAPVRAPRSAEFIFIDSGQPVLPTLDDPLAMRRGLIAEGEVMLYGQRKRSFVALAGNALPGTSTLIVEDKARGWRQGDSVVVASTSFDKEKQLENEVTTIARITDNAIDVDPHLVHPHRIDARMRVHVANLTRSIVFSSERDEPSRRGHVMLMNCRSVVQGVAFERLGRTDKLEFVNDAVIAGGQPVHGTGTNPRGRYALHFHQCGLDGGVGVVRNSVVNGSPGWGMAVHKSRVDFVDNVVFDFVGAGFVAEDGDEIATFKRNIALGGRGNGTFQLRRVYQDVGERVRAADFAFHGDGFWFQSPFVEVVDNVAAGNKGVGFFFHPAGINKDGGVGLPDAYAEELGFADMLADARRWKSSLEPLVTQFPITRFEGNSAYGNFIGLKIRYSQSISTSLLRNFDDALEDDVDRRGDPDAYAPYDIQRCSFWNNKVGVNVSYAAGATFRDVFIGSSLAPDDTRLNDETWVAYEGWHRSVHHMAIDGMSIAGYPIGLLLRDPAATSVANVRYVNVALPVTYNDDNLVRE